MATWITNAFSLNMLGDHDIVDVRIRRLELHDAQPLAAHAVSAVGHDDTAQLLGTLLGLPVPVNRASLELATGDTLLVGQYRGPRLAPGETRLPDGAHVAWYRLDLVDAAT